jgi:hypothetical protein
LTLVYYLTNWMSYASSNFFLDVFVRLSLQEDLGFSYGSGLLLRTNPFRHLSKVTARKAPINGLSNKCGGMRYQSLRGALCIKESNWLRRGSTVKLIEGGTKSALDSWMRSK